MKIALFKVDVSGLIGVPLCSGLLPNAESQRDPQFARGVILDDGKIRVVLCAVDYCEIGGIFYQEWKKCIAKAAGTGVKRVHLHSVHQHQAPFLRYIEYMEGMDHSHGHTYGFTSAEKRWWRETTAKLQKSIQQAARQFQKIAFVSTGEVKISGMASNRRIIGADGKLKETRWSVCADPKVRKLPVGLIDPKLQTISFWDASKELVATISFYGTHPQCSRGSTAHSAEITGEALNRLSLLYPKAHHLYFTACEGQITLGKYSSLNVEKNMSRFGQKLSDSIDRAIKRSAKTRVKLVPFQHRTVKIGYPFQLQGSIKNWRGRVLHSKTDRFTRYSILAMYGAQKNQKILKNQVVTCLQIGKIKIISLPGEPFIEYQLYGKSLDRKSFVAFAAIGDCTPGYIPTKKAYREGGYEVSAGAAFSSPKIEKVLKAAIKKALSGKLKRES